MNEMKQILNEADEQNNIIGGIAVDRLRSLIERIEHLEEQKKGVQDDIKDVFTEAKSAGFDVKAIRAVLKLRKLSDPDREGQDLILELYRKVLDL